MPSISKEDRKKLLSHHYATIGLFVAFLIFCVVTILTIEFLEISERTQNNLIGTLFGAAIVLSLLQFARCCPNCHVNLGWQLRLGIPKNCVKCGQQLR